MKTINPCLKYFHLITFFLLITYNCKDSDKPVKESEFTKTILINNKDLDSIKIAPVLLHERKIIATDKYLISMNIDSDIIYRVFKHPDYEYLGSFGKHGRGPQEFTYPNISGFRLDQEGIVLTDFNSVNLVNISTNENNDLNIFFNRVYQVPAELMPLNEAFILNDSIICGASKEKMELVCFNCVDNEVGFLIPLPNMYPEASSIIKSLLYINHLAISPNRSSIAILYSRFPLLRIYNVKTKEVIETNIKEGPAQIRFTYDERRLTNSIDSYGYYNNIVVTNKYIYGGFQAHKKERTERGIKPIPLSKKQIHIFNWHGETRLKIELEENWFNVFTASHDDQYLYFIHPFKENYIYRYKLPKI